jgi:hypothetical protein
MSRTIMPRFATCAGALATVAAIATAVPASATASIRSHRPSTPIPTSKALAPAASSRSLQILPTAVKAVPEAPRDWAVSGQGCKSTKSGWSAWCELVLGLEIVNNKTGAATDRIIARITVNPGAHVSKVSYTVSYSPNGGHLTQVHIDTCGLCYIQREVCSDEIDGIKPPTSGLLHPLTPNMRGHQLGHRFTLSAYCKVCVGNKYGNYSRRTGTATCNKSSNNCYYPR